MATLRGQNLRILLLDSGQYKIIAMSTNCNVNLTNNTENSETKDTVGFGMIPTVVSHAWNVSVDSLDVSDVHTLLVAIKNKTKFTLMWSETSDLNNQVPLCDAAHRIGQAIINDATFQFDDRTNSVKQLQFMGCGPLQKLSEQPEFTTVHTSAYTKGQFIRLFLSSDNTTTPNAVIAAARQLSLHVSLQMESMTTKDTEGDWDLQEPTGLNFDISTTALVRSADTITSSVGAKGLSDLEDMYEEGTPVKFVIANTSGDNNRTKGTAICSGSCLITQLSVSSQNRQAVTYTASFTGYGDYT